VELDLDGAVVLVTGGVRGVGLGITQAFLAAGAVVVTCARRPAEVAGASFVQCDVRDADQVSALVAGIVARFGRLDVVVNNAGGAPFALADKASPRFHSKVVELNLLAPLLVSQAAYEVMRTSGGSIVNVSSVSGRRPSPGTAAYGAAKAGLDSLTSSLAVGMVRTEQSHLHYGSEAGIEAVARTVPLGRLASPDEIGACAVFLASPLASYVTGATLVVHGGGEVPAFLAAADGGSS